MLSSDVLILNSAYVPIRISDVRESICLLLSEKARPVVEEDTYVKSPSISIRVPSVISLVGYKDYPHRKVHFTRLNVIYRDDQTCQYCGKRYPVTFLTMDHIIPRSRWNGRKSPTNWYNVVCACKTCNSKKGSKLVTELGWKLLSEPKEPVYAPHLVINFDKAQRRGWLPFCKTNVRLVHYIK